jgi:hypothetical protein
METDVTPVKIIVLGSVGVLHAEAGGYDPHAHVEAEPGAWPIFCEMVNKEHHAVQQLSGAVQA